MPTDDPRAQRPGVFLPQPTGQPPYTSQLPPGTVTAQAQSIFNTQDPNSLLAWLEQQLPGGLANFLLALIQRGVCACAGGTPVADLWQLIAGLLSPVTNPDNVSTTLTGSGTSILDNTADNTRVVTSLGFGQASVAARAAASFAQMQANDVGADRSASFSGVGVGIFFLHRNADAYYRTLVGVGQGAPSQVWLGLFETEPLDADFSTGGASIAFYVDGTDLKVKSRSAAGVIKHGTVCALV